MQALSVRKLVLESAKFNVITAHSTREALEVIEAFPRISAAVLVAEENIGCEQIAEAIHKKLPNVPVIGLCPHEGARCQGADHQVSSYNPEELVQLVRDLLGDPRSLDGK